MRRVYTLWLSAVTLIALMVSAMQARIEQKRAVHEVDAQASALATTVEESLLVPYRAKRIAKAAARLQAKQGVLALALCPIPFAPGATKPPRIFPAHAPWKNICSLPYVRKAAETATEISWTGGPPGSETRFLAHPARNTTLVLAHDLSHLREHWLAAFLRTALLAWLAGFALLFIVASHLRGWIAQQLRVLKTLSTTHTRAAARPSQEDSRTASLRNVMRGRELVVIANREPYIHQKRADLISVVRPASGLVAALEPILRQCGGLWIAHGSGSADVETANSAGEVAVPPGRPTYTLRRVWLDQEQESGYYYGFSNEGLWPLCHLAHNRPVFRLNDWNQYREVNHKFCASIPQRIFDGNSVILVQDYHFALLPQMVRDASAGRGPKVALFWHIPWPNPEAFGILPWGEDLLRGMLGAHVIGFHTQYHCNNFLETCDRYLEARVDWENFSVTRDNQETLVRAFPIGIDTAPVQVLSDQAREELKKKLGIGAQIVAIGVDRLDYTKGLLERIEAVERFLEKNPQYVGHFSLVQIGSPSRTQIGAYRDLAEKLEQLVARVNARFGQPGYSPVILLAEHHEWEQIQSLYQLGDVCMVTSLHDGMNLVAKEYVWCQRPERGSLILSKFTGASRELTEAFIVNPYSIEEMADALAEAIALTPAEKAARMSAMREKVRARSAFHWAADLIHSVVKTGGTVSIPHAGTDHRDKSRSTRAFG